MYTNYKDRGLTGLANLGNTCFLNSALQCFSHSYDFNNFLIKSDLKYKLNKKPESLILMEWDKLRQMIWGENCIISPGGFVTSIQKVAKIKNRKIFTGNAQNDLPEFVIFLIDCFHSAIAREVNMTINGEVQNNKDKIAKECYKMMQHMYKKDFSELLDFFYGSLVSKISALDNSELSIKLEPFNILSLPIPPGSNPTLSDCLDLYTSKETLDGDNQYLNPKTNQKEDATKQILFWHLPKILIVDLKRFNNNMRKDNRLIDFTLENWDLSKYVIGYNNKDFCYDLYGICNHGGNVFGGHYTAFIKNANNKWYHFNDTSVTEIPAKQVKTNKAYCFFYRKKKSL